MMDLARQTVITKNEDQRLKSNDFIYLFFNVTITPILCGLCDVWDIRITINLLKIRIINIIEFEFEF